MRIGFVCHSSNAAGGGERCTLEAIESLRARGVECRVILPSDGSLGKELSARGYETKVIPYTWWMSDDELGPVSRLRRLARNLLAVPRVADALREWKCDAVYTSTITTPVGAAAARRLGLPHVWHLYEFGFEDHQLRFDLGDALSRRLIGRWSVLCVAVSKAISEKYAPFIPAAKLKLVYFAVGAPPERAPSSGFLADDGLKCLIAGRLQEKKGQEDAIRAVGELEKAGVRATLLVAGRGDEPWERRLKELAAPLGARVRFLGHDPGVFALMKQADVVLMCSRQEALGRVTVEAMYAGKPVVGARSGGTPELVRDGFNGFLYEPGNAAELALKLRAFADDPKLGPRLGAEGGRWALETFSEERLGRDLETALYEAGIEK